ncbi:HET-domain-containing protein, partial [Mollisia scopiformis]
EFRIVRVAPGGKDDRIMCWLVVTSISQPLNYEALTYSWGDMRHFNKIELQSSEASPSKRFTIRNNLYSLLRSLRHPSNTMSFWVDAICINQNNAHDKARQAKLMQNIYNSAQNIYPSCNTLAARSGCKT